MTHTTIDRLAVKTLDQRFRYELETGFEIAPRVARGILELAKEVFGLDAVSDDRSGRLRPGQMRQIIAAAGAPHGPPLCQTKMTEVTWTLEAGEEDVDVLKKNNRVALRRARILRLVDEALDQGGEPTQEDLSKALCVSARTIRSDIAALRAEGYRVVTRGMLRGVGRGQSHKVIIVELYLKRYTYSDIMRRVRHSPKSIKRYVQTFGRVVMLIYKGLSTAEIAHAVGISERLTREYLDLYQRYNIPEYQARLAEIIQMLSGGQQKTTTPKKGG